MLIFFALGVAVESKTKAMISLTRVYGAGLRLKLCYI